MCHICLCKIPRYTSVDDVKCPIEGNRVEHNRGLHEFLQPIALHSPTKQPRAERIYDEIILILVGYVLHAVPAEFHNGTIRNCLEESVANEMATLEDFPILFRQDFKSSHFIGNAF